MRCFRSLVLVCLTAYLGTTPVWAFRIPDSQAAPLTQHQLDLRYTANRPQPYAMNYADDAARTLGIQDGKWEAFNTRSSDPLMPSLKGGIDGGRAMIGLQWRPGQ